MKPVLNRMTGRILSATALVAVMAVTSATAQNSQRAGATDALHQLNDSIEALVRRISPSVVQIMVRGYHSTETTDAGQADVIIGRERAIGSGVVVDPEGYIVTNAHVVQGAQQIEVILPDWGMLHWMRTLPGRRSRRVWWG